MSDREGDLIRTERDLIERIDTIRLDLAPLERELMGVRVALLAYWKRHPIKV